MTQPSLEPLDEGTNCELCCSGKSDEWECPICCRKIVEFRFPLDEHKIYDELIQDKTLTGKLHQSQIRGIAKLIVQCFGASGQRVVKWPEKENLDYVGFGEHKPTSQEMQNVINEYWFNLGRNEGINACQQAFEEAQRGK